MTREQAFKDINETQDYYVHQLYDMINDSTMDIRTIIDFKSPTGTGKTKMMAKLIKLFDSEKYYFIITSLSKGQLHRQIRTNLSKDLSDRNNFFVYGSADYKINSRLDAMDIISRIPKNAKCIWLRDEGHIKTNRFDELLLSKCYKIVNFSATPDHADIECNFAHTMMLRTVNQCKGTPEDVINKLIEIKKIHSNIKHYNPCLIVRDVNNTTVNTFIELCCSNNLKYINIINENYNIQELCKDDNEYDVIINKFKIVEGIDIRRAHVLYMDNQPKNISTTIQSIGRCRRNALLYRDDIDILAEENADLLKATRECYVYYNVENMKIDTDENGELQYAFCNRVSCQELKADTTIDVVDGQLSNGLYVIELEGKTGSYSIKIDASTGFNIVEPETDFYNTQTRIVDNNYLYVFGHKIHIDNIKYFPISTEHKVFDYYLCDYRNETVEPYYNISTTPLQKINVPYKYSATQLKLFKDGMNKYSYDYIYSKLCNYDVSKDYKKTKYNINEINSFVTAYIEKHRGKKGHIQFVNTLCILGEYKINMRYMEYSTDSIIENICNKESITIISYFAILYRQSGHTNEEVVQYLTEKISCYYYNYKLVCETDKLTKSTSKFLYYVFDNNMNIIYSTVKSFTPFNIVCKIPQQLVVTNDNITNWFAILDNVFSIIETNNYKLSNVVNITNNILNVINESYKYVSDNIIPCVAYDYSNIIEWSTDDDIQTPFFSTWQIPTSAVKHFVKQTPYTKLINDRESAIIGTDVLKPFKDKNDNVIWIESSSVTSKIRNYTKLNRFIKNNYNSELLQVKDKYFTGKNSFVIDNRCNKVLGWCVEYYSKYLVYGQSYLGHYLDVACREANGKINDGVIIRACLLKYKAMMVRSFGKGVEKVIRLISIEKLICNEYAYFVNLVKELATKVANFVKSTLYYNKDFYNNVDPNLSITHIKGLADYITNDTILDIKVANHIDESMIRQVLAYHYLSTKRSDLNIKRVIVYDATSGKSITVNIDPKNYNKNFDENGNVIMSERLVRKELELIS